MIDRDAIAKELQKEAKNAREFLEDIYTLIVIGGSVLTMRSERFGLTVHETDQLLSKLADVTAFIAKRLMLEEKISLEDINEIHFSSKSDMLERLLKED